MTVASVELPSRPGGEAIVQVAVGEGFIVALDAAGGVFKLDLTAPPEQFWSLRDRFARAVQSGERSWQRLPRFCDPEAIAQHLTLANVDLTTFKPRITLLVAHFRTFFAVSAPEPASSSVVLQGSAKTTAQSTAIVLPELQGIGVVRVALGDWHYGAQTADGRLLTWGGISAGALGRPPTAPEKPTAVVFPGSEPFVFNSAFSGHHSAALVIDDDPLELVATTETEADGDADERMRRRRSGGVFGGRVQPRFGRAFADRGPPALGNATGEQS